MPSEYSAAAAAAAYLMEQYEENQRRTKMATLRGGQTVRSPRPARPALPGSPRSAVGSPRSPRSPYYATRPQTVRRARDNAVYGDYQPERVSWTAGGLAVRANWTSPSGRPKTAGPDPAFDLPVVYGRYTAPEYANDRELLLRKSLCVGRH